MQAHEFPCQSTVALFTTADAALEPYIITTLEEIRLALEEDRFPAYKKAKLEGFRQEEMEKEAAQARR